MKLSTAYMQREEFKARQGSFSFFCAQAYEFVKQFATECRAGWEKLFSSSTQFVNRTLELPFAALTHREWQKLAQQTELRLVTHK